MKGTLFSDGRLLVTGQFITRFTNLQSEKSIDVNTTNPATLTFNEDGSTDVVARG